jgi:hypothetical protein
MDCQQKEQAYAFFQMIYTEDNNTLSPSIGLEGYMEPLD